MVLINLPAVQNFVAKQAVDIFSKQLDTKVSLKYVRLSLLNKVILKEFYVEDKNADTLLYAGEASVRITDWFIFRRETPVLKYIGLKDAYANLHRAKDSEEWNYQFVIDAFDTGEKDTTKKQSIDIDLKTVALENVRFHMNDAWVGSDMNFEVGQFDIDADKVDLKKKIIDIDEIIADKTHIILREYEGGRPPQPPKPQTGLIDTTAFNPDKWEITISKIKLEKCLFQLDAGNREPLYKEFDPSHMRISDIGLDIEDVAINGDTLTAKMKDLHATERCGLVVKKLKADIRLSPNESILDNLLLETNNSSISRYYAMHYDRFPDFNDYLAKVRMVADFEDAKVDANDVAYFAPVLREYATLIHITGKIDGTVEDIDSKGLKITDGYTTVKGDLSFEGLPDINETYISYNNGELFTSGDGIIKYVPSLKNDSSIAIRNLTYAYFKGDFEGYINDFVLNGAITTNLGSITSDIKMDIPHKDSIPYYNGKVTVSELNIGALINDTSIGTVSLNATVEGRASNKDNADIKFDASITQLEYNGYNYQNITADGTLAKQRFDGNLLIDDPNLALGFYGVFDYSDEEHIGINAKANLIHSDLTTLRLVKEDSILFSADFDLDWVGNNLDDFVGTARLYNINMIRNNKRLDIDSVFAKSTKQHNAEKLIIESNAFAATITGSYNLTNLANSFQYYLAGYIPNYIKKPSGDAPHQDISIELQTRDLDNLFNVFVPSISGFSNTTLIGELNTGTQKLTLHTHIPSGKYNDITFKNTDIKANGNFNNLTVNLQTDTVLFTDTATYGSLNINTKIGNDRLDFSIETSSPNAFNTANFSGYAVAQGDTLNIAFQPSEFYLHDDKWVIPSGSRITYTEGYLYVNGLYLQSGKQKISFNSQNAALKQKLNIDIVNIDLSEIGALAGIGNLKPEGTLTGEVSLENMFTNFSVNTQIKAKGLKLGDDEIGQVIIEGKYDGGKHYIDFEPATGIYNGSKSLTVNGKISFDSTNTEYIDGNINFNNAPLFWLAPVLNGFVSNLSGELDGKIKIGGTSSYPDIDGRIGLNKIGMHIDFLGTDYRIPEGTININNKRIDLGRIRLYDKTEGRATLSGGISHNRFKNMRMGINLSSDKFQVIELKRSESDLFYGNLIAKFDNMSVDGPFDNIRIRIDRAEPAAESHLYLPVSSGSEEVGAYSYISFRNPNAEEDSNAVERKDKNKLSIHIDAILNPLATITLIMDPTTGDAINASGTGNISMDIPPDNDIRMYGNFTIQEGDYTFTLKQLFFRRKFMLNSGSEIQFTGPIDNTQLKVEGVYRTRARLYDLLRNSQKTLVDELGGREQDEAKLMRDVDVILNMTGSLASPDLNFEIELPDKSASGTIAYKKLEQVNRNETDLFNQVASLLLINSFIPAEGGFEGGASTGVVNNISDIFSGTASSQLTNLISKLTGDDDLAVNFKYQQYSYNNGASTSGNAQRNEVSLGIRKQLFNDRLSIEVGSSLDWGKPSSGGASASNFNPAGDFRLQYLIREGGNLRASIFRTSSYDILVDRNISRGGVGLTWRKSFNTLSGLLGNDDAEKMKEKEEMLDTDELPENTADSVRNDINAIKEEDE